MSTSKSILGGMFDSTSVIETIDGFPRGNMAVDSTFFARMLQCFYTDGVVKPDEGGMQVTAGTGLQIVVQPGCGWIRGHMAWVREAETATVTAGNTYLVLLRLHCREGGFTLEFNKDTAAPVRGENYWDLCLARVVIPTGAEAVTTDMITDLRTDEALCGAVYSPIDGLEAVAFASNAGAVGGLSADALVPKVGGKMNGTLQAYNDTTGGPAVRNIRYGTSLPDMVAEGEIFLLLAEG